MNCDSLVETLPISVNGREKVASGLTKRTTIDDIIFAMLSVSDSKFNRENLVDYAIFEKWQGNERMLDGKLKIYKIIRLWQSLPGDQLSQVKFTIKKRKYALADYKKAAEAQKFNSNSPSMCKSWNVDKASNALKTSARKNILSNETNQIDRDVELERYEKKYSTVKKFNRAKNSTVRKTEIKKSFIELVSKQNEIIDKQLNKLNKFEKMIDNQNEKKQSSKRRSKSLDNKSQKSKSLKRDGSVKLRIRDDEEKKNDEYLQICNKFVELEDNLNSKLKKIVKLNEKLNALQRDSKKKQVQETNMNNELKTSLEIFDKQSDKLNNINESINRIDEIIVKKTNFIKSLEIELKNLENDDEALASIYSEAKKTLKTTVSTSSTSSSLSSTSSNLTSVSQQLPNVTFSPNEFYQTKKIVSAYDNESDTGISSANSEECYSHFETLV